MEKKSPCVGLKDGEGREGGRLNEAPEMQREGNVGADAPIDAPISLIINSHQINLNFVRTNS